MLGFAVDCTTASEFKSTDLLELYCGNGNFTAPMSKNFRRVLATEISRGAGPLTLTRRALL